MEENKPVTTEECLKEEMLHYTSDSFGRYFKEDVLRAMERHTQQLTSENEQLRELFFKKAKQVEHLTAENERLREVFEDLLGCYIESQNTPNISNATRSLWRKAAGINLTP